MKSELLWHRMGGVLNRQNVFQQCSQSVCTSQAKTLHFWLFLIFFRPHMASISCLGERGILYIPPLFEYFFDFDVVFRILPCSQYMLFVHACACSIRTELAFIWAAFIGSLSFIATETHTFLYVLSSPWFR